MQLPNQYVTPDRLLHQVPWTSGSVGVKADLSKKWQTGGGWGNMRIHEFGSLGQLGSQGAIEGTCTRNAGQPCDPSKLDHGG